MALRELSASDLDAVLARCAKHALFDNVQFHRDVTQLVLDNTVDEKGLEKLIKAGLCLDSYQVRHHLRNYFDGDKGCMHCTDPADFVRALITDEVHLNDLLSYEDRNMLVHALWNGLEIESEDSDECIGRLLVEMCHSELHWTSADVFLADLNTLLARDQDKGEEFAQYTIHVAGKDVTHKLPALFEENEALITREHLVFMTDYCYHRDIDITDELAQWFETLCFAPLLTTLVAACSAGTKKFLAAALRYKGADEHGHHRKVVDMLQKQAALTDEEEDSENDDE